MKEESAPPSIKDALSEIHKKLGLKVSKISDREGTLDVQAVPSGSLSLDDAIGVGGFPRGRVIEIYGKQQGGKTLISLLAIAQAQKLGGNAAFIDVEHAFDPAWATKLGVDVPNLFFTQPDYGEQALSVILELAKTNQFDVIVLDSTAALVPKEELEGELTQSTIALQARMMSKALRVLTPEVGKSKSVVIFINQIRNNPMVMYGSPITTPGGEALKFYCSVRLEVSRISKSEILDGDLTVGHRVKAKVVKNKVAAPFKAAEFLLRYDTGVDRIDEIATLVLDRGIVQTKGPMYYFETKSWKGREAFLTELIASPELQATLAARIQAR